MSAVTQADNDDLTARIEQLEAQLLAAHNIIEAAAAKEREKRPQNCGTGFCSCIECPYPDHFPDAGKMIERNGGGK